MSAEIESIDNYTTLDELPQTYIDAVLSVEDKRFYSHPGIDPIAIGRALVNDIKTGAGDRENEEGGLSGGRHNSGLKRK